MNQRAQLHKEISMEQQGAYRTAERKVEARLGFYGHLGIYILVNALLVVINFLTSPEYLWSLWPLLGWGIGLVAHMLKVFAIIDGSDLKRRMVEKQVEKDTLANRGRSGRM
jgi:hypothetical protein